MAGQFKKLLNLAEATTEKELAATCERNGARVFPKVRVADVLPIDRSGISNELYSFALKAHFDFVVTEHDSTPLFAVEYDGPSHSAVIQSKRDEMKDKLCERFELPLLRIDASYVNRTYRRLTLLAWFIEMSFSQRAINEAQTSGQIPPDEYLDPMDVVQMPGLPGQFPLWIGARGRLWLQRACEAGHTREFAPMTTIGVDSDGNYHGLACIRFDEHRGASVSVRMRAQRFHGIVREAMHEVLVQHLADRAAAILDGSEPSELLIDILSRIRSMQATLDRCGLEGQVWLDS